MKTELPFFDYLGTNPPFDMYSNNFMQAYRAGNTMWYESHPVASRLAEGFKNCFHLACGTDKIAMKKLLHY